MAIQMPPMIGYWVHSQPPQVPAIGFNQKVEEPLSTMKIIISAKLRYNLKDVRLYKGTDLIEDNKLPIDYGIVPRETPWDLTLVHRLPNGKFPETISTPKYSVPVLLLDTSSSDDD